MKPLYAVCLTLPLLLIPLISADQPSTGTQVQEQEKPRSTVIKKGMTQAEVERILLPHCILLKRFEYPVSAIVHRDPRDRFSASFHSPEGKSGYFLFFEWDARVGTHRLDGILHTADLDALLENYGSKASIEVEDFYRPVSIDSINLGSPY